MPTIRVGATASSPSGVVAGRRHSSSVPKRPSRSGLAARHGLSIVNTPGTVDAGYRGEVKVLLVNHDPHETVELRRGDRVAQLVVQRVERVAFEEVGALPESVRGTGGYGSTGGFGPATGDREESE